MISPSNSSGPATFARIKSRSSDIGKERTLVDLSLPRHSALSARTSSSPVRVTEISTDRSLSARPGYPLSAMAAVAALRASSSQGWLLSHSSSASMAISSITGSAPRPFIGLDDPADERMADDIGGTEADHAELGNALELPNRI